MILPREMQVKRPPILNQIIPMRRRHGAIISQIRQLLSINGRQVSDTPLVKASQRGSGPSSVNKRTHGRINTCITCPICSPRKPNSLIEELNDRIPNRLQTNPMKSHWKIRLKLAIEISDNSQQSKQVYTLPISWHNACITNAIEQGCGKN